jgi:hypothetical protein
MLIIAGHLSPLAKDVSSSVALAAVTFARSLKHRSIWPIHVRTGITQGQEIREASYKCNNTHC